MPLPSNSGIVWYVSSPGWGKTYKALEDAKLLIKSTGRPLLVIDSQRVDNLRRIKHYDTLRDTFRAVWQRREHAAFEPDTADEVEKIAEACRQAGNVILLVDESSYWINGGKRNSALIRLMRAHRHCNVTMLLTTQHFSGDIPQDARSCSPVIYAGRVTSPASLAVLEKWYGVTRAQLDALPLHKFLDLSIESVEPPANAPAVAGGHSAAQPPATPGSETTQQ